MVHGMRESRDRGEGKLNGAKDCPEGGERNEEGQGRGEVLGVH